MRSTLCLSSALLTAALMLPTSGAQAQALRLGAAPNLKATALASPLAAEQVQYRGGPGWGGRPGWGRPGWGPGPQPGWGPGPRPGWGGPGWGPRPGWGPGWGPGPRPGWGPGWGPRPVWNGGWGYAPGWGPGPGWGWGPGWGFGPGFATGVIIGSAAASAPPPPAYNNWVAYCSQRFKSYNPRTGTYLGYDGRRHSCP